MASCLPAADSIFALSSGIGRAGVAVYRLSGSLSAQALQKLSRKPLPAPRQAKLVSLYDREGERLDRGLAIWFPSPQSFTGEDVVELHLHGGRAIALALADALADCGLRPAEPGEFSRRAFAHGKLDLTQIEAIADLVAAETALQRRQALRQLDGALNQLYEGWRERILRAQAHFEAAIDFSDEDLPLDLLSETRLSLGTLAEEIAGHLEDGGRGERLRDGLSIAILGAPNVGKSSLLNCLAGRPAAIVSAVAGTTRDIIEVHLDLAGYPVILADTAGLRETEEVIEQEGVRRAQARAQSADLRLVIFDAQNLPLLDEASMALLGPQSIAVINKCDTVSMTLPDFLQGQPVIGISALSGLGLEALIEKLKDLAAPIMAGGSNLFLTRARYRTALAGAVEALRRAMQEELSELAAEDVRLAAAAVGRITGRIDVEEVLDVIFRDFCIGK